jgi:hypothetical protein
MLVMTGAGGSGRSARERDKSDGKSREISLWGIPRVQDGLLGKDEGGNQLTTEGEAGLVESQLQQVLTRVEHAEGAEIIRISGTWTAQPQDNRFKHGVKNMKHRAASWVARQGMIGSGRQRICLADC